MTPLETERLILRLPSESDFDAFAAMNADPEVMRYIGDGQPMSRPQAWRKLALIVGHWSLRGYGLCSVLERSTGEFVGCVGLWNPEGWPGLELGWMLRRASWQKGYATEAASAALQYAFAELNRSSVISLIHPENVASIRVAERLGERRMERIELMGKPTLNFAITREQWAREQPSAL